MVELLSICETEGVRFFWRELDPWDGLLLGMYFVSPRGRPVIALDESLASPGRVRLARCVLMEEIAHYWTTPTADHLRHRDNSLNTQAIWRDESRAIRLAANHLIPTEELAAAVNRGLSSPHELAEHFQVEEWMVWRKFHILRKDLREQYKLKASSGDILSPLLVSVMWGQAV